MVMFAGDESTRWTALDFGREKWIGSKASTIAKQTMLAKLSWPAVGKMG